MRWKREGLARAFGARRTGIESAQESIRGDLERRGLAADFAEALARRLESQLDGADGATRDAVLDGVAAAYAVESQTNEGLAQNLRDLGELEQLMKSFAGELSKLDESLEVLAAYLRRMRAKGTPVSSNRILH
ncbi:MAG: hypothetical protein ACQGVK_06995 [Myxococcota bacterium]